MISNRDQLIAFAKTNNIREVKAALEENLENNLLEFQTPDDFITTYQEAPELALLLIHKQPDKFIPILENIVLANLKQFFAFSELCHQHSDNLIYDFIRNHSNQIVKLFKTEDDFITFARRYRTGQTEALIRNQPRYFVDLFHTNFKTAAFGRLHACDVSAGAYLISLMQSVQREKKDSSKFYTQGALFGLFNDSLPRELTNSVAEYLPLQDGIQAANASQAAHTEAETVRYADGKKLARF